MHQLKQPQANVTIMPKPANDFTTSSLVPYIHTVDVYVYLLRSILAIIQALWTRSAIRAQRKWRHTPIDCSVCWIDS